LSIDRDDFPALPLVVFVVGCDDQQLLVLVGSHSQHFICFAAYKSDPWLTFLPQHCSPFVAGFRFIVVLHDFPCRLIDLQHRAVLPGHCNDILILLLLEQKLLTLFTNTIYELGSVGLLS